MVKLPKVVMDIVRHARGNAPEWAYSLFSQLNKIEWKVSLLMAVDTQVVAKLVAAAGALADQSKKVAAERDQYKALADQEGLQISDLQGQLSTSAATDAASTDAINAAADAVSSLVDSPSTPDVAVPPIEDVPGVVDGTTPVTAPDGGDVAEPTDGGAPADSLTDTGVVTPDAPVDAPATDGSDVPNSDQF